MSCNDNGKRDAILSDIITSRKNSKINQLLATVKKSVAEIEQQVKQRPIERPPITEPSNTEQQRNPKFRLADPDGLRIRGIPEPDRSRYSTKEAQLKCDMESIRDVMNHLEIDCEILDLRRLGNYDDKKNRSILVTVNPWKKRLILSTLGKLTTYKTNVYINRDLS